MEKQVHSNQQERINNLQDKFNNITTFLTKFIFQGNFDMLKKSGYIDAYTSDPEIMNILELTQRQRFLFLLFKNKKLNLEDLKKITTSLALVPVDVVFSYELVNDYSMIVLEFPDRFVEDFDHIIEGRFSKLSDSFKDRFDMTREVINTKGQVMGKEYTLYYHIFNKTQWLKDFWLDRLGLCELDPKLELWEKPSEKDKIFNIKTII
jgi:hypothetical protein